MIALNSTIKEGKSLHRSVKKLNSTLPTFNGLLSNNKIVYKCKQF